MNKELITEEDFKKDIEDQYKECLKTRERLLVEIEVIEKLLKFWEEEGKANG